MSDNLLPYALGFLWGGIEEESKREAARERTHRLQERINNGDLLAYFEAKDIYIYDKKVRAAIESFEQPGGQKEYLLKLIEAKKKPLDKRYTTDDDLGFMNDVNAWTMRELQGFLDEAQMTYTVYLKLKAREDEKEKEIRLKREEWDKEQERLRIERGPGPSGLQIFMIVLIVGLILVSIM